MTPTKKRPFSVSTRLLAIATLVLLTLFVIRYVLGWQAVMKRKAEIRQASITGTVSRGHLTDHEAARLYDAMSDKNWKHNNYSDEELAFLVQLGTDLRGTMVQARDRRAEVHGALTYFVQSMSPQQKARVADYAKFEIRQDDHGPGGAYDLECAFEMLGEIGDSRYADLIKPYTGDPRKSVSNSALVNLTRLRTGTK